MALFEPGESGWAGESKVKEISMVVREGNFNEEYWRKGTTHEPNNVIYILVLIETYCNKIPILFHFQLISDLPGVVGADIATWVAGVLGGSKTKEISMKNIGVKVLITNRII